MFGGNRGFVLFSMRADRPEEARAPLRQDAPWAVCGARSHTRCALLGWQNTALIIRKRLLL